MNIFSVVFALLQKKNEKCLDGIKKSVSLHVDSADSAAGGRFIYLDWSFVFLKIK